MESIEPEKFVGSILLIHGSAPFNKDGRVPDSRAGKYAKMAFYKDLSDELERFGWKTFRYNKTGVTNHKVDYSKYKKTDLSHLKNQLNEIWKSIPKDKPRFVFAWSEGSLHISQLPMDEIDGVVILGGISTNIRDVILWQARNEKSKMLEQLKEIEKMPREKMLGLDRPVGRLLDELRMKNNWQYFESYGSLPILVIHGEADVEVPIDQAYTWKRKLPDNSIKLLTQKERNHTFGLGDSHGAKEIANAIHKWRSESSTH